MDRHSRSGQQAEDTFNVNNQGEEYTARQETENIYAEEYIDREHSTRHVEESVPSEENKEIKYPNRQELRKAQEEKGYKQRFLGMNKNKSVEEPETDGYTRSRSRKPKSKKKADLFWGKIVLKILAVAAVCYNIHFLLNFMNDSFSSLYHTISVVGICIAINYIAIWILFYKNALIRFYLSLIAILGALGYYFYTTYTTQSILGHNLVSSALVAVAAVIAINPKVNYYVKSLAFMVIPLAGIYLSGNKFALVWALLFNAGLILFFRVAKSNKKEPRFKRKQKQSAYDSRSYKQN
ncbi:hypothetical protein [Heyndrickxia acidicola]|uniref:Uncharacterized protein n=1 Tax=Heyndrickxia acidicola TaxID=209389 RepID=A0ABU6MJU4_9BACI|nr:hypothetical protein [Heyndrickxia acidicola]MED1204569.1 hypothetical protein [Heyndrickxia acidicola]